MSKDIAEPWLIKSSLGDWYRIAQRPYATPTIKNREARPVDRPNAAMEPRPLDPIELEVLTLFANGKSTEEIGTKLTLHKSVVQDYLRVAARKLGAANRTHAAVIATELGLVKTAKRGICR